MSGRKSASRLQARVTGAKVVDRRLEAQGLIVIDDAANMAVVLHLFHLGELEHDLLDGKEMLAGRLQRGADAALRAIDRIGQEVDAQHAPHIEAGGQRAMALIRHS